MFKQFKHLSCGVSCISAISDLIVLVMFEFSPNWTHPNGLTNSGKISKHHSFDQPLIVLAIAFLLIPKFIVG
jgi:hypothetical protein